MYFNINNVFKIESVKTVKLEKEDRKITIVEMMYGNIGQYKPQ